MTADDLIEVDVCPGFRTALRRSEIRALIERLRLIGDIPPAISSGRITGTVLSYSHERWTGFVIPDGASRQHQAFFNRDDVASCTDPAKLERGSRVRFTIGAEQGGPHASKLRAREVELLD